MTATELEPLLLDVIAKFRASDATAKLDLQALFRDNPDNGLLLLMERLKRSERLLVQWDIDAALEELRQTLQSSKPAPPPAEPVAAGGPRGARAKKTSKPAAARQLALEDDATPRFFRWLQDGRLACVDTNHRVHLIDVPSMTVTARLDRHAHSSVGDFDIARSGTRLVTIVQESLLSVWNEKGERVREIQVPEPGGYRCRLVDEGRQVVIKLVDQQSSHAVRLYDVRTGEQRGAVDVGSPELVLPLVSFNGDDDQTVLVVDSFEGVLLHTWSGGRTRAYGFPGLYGKRADDDQEIEFRVIAVAASLEFGVALLGEDGTATVWNREVGRTRLTLDGEYQAVAISPNSERLFAARGERIELWDLDERRLLGRLATGAPSLLKVTNDLALVGVDDTLSVWRTTDRKRLGVFPLDSPPYDVAARGSEIFVATQSGEIRALPIAGLDLPPTDFELVLN